MFVVWFTGLPSAGKSTLARLVGNGLAELGLAAQVLDGDLFRRDTTPQLGYTQRDRARNVEALAYSAAAAVRSGAPALVAAISPYEQARRRAREIVEAHARFVEVFVDARLETCIGRDPKGLYKRALAGQLAHFTGISDPYEVPAKPDLVVNTDALDPLGSAELVLVTLARLALTPLPPHATGYEPARATSS